MNQCPGCGTTGILTLTPILVAQPAASYSLAGAQLKTTATHAAVLACGGCGWQVTGRVENLQLAADGTITAGHLIVDAPSSSTTSGDDTANRP